MAGVPLALEPLNRKDFTSDQEVRWCPGCGDYAVLAAFQGFMPELGIRKENTVIVSGIGCSSRFPYYVDSYGMHSIHGRATAIATGVATAREDAAVFVITGDGDALSIGGNHLIHVLRRNVNLTILLFNNRIYGLTKGQYSPTSEIGKITKSTPMGSLDNPFNPVSLALGAEATFVARTIDSDRKHLTDVLRAAAAHRGTSFVEIYQNCPIFNDDAFASMKDAETSAEAIIPLRHGEPIRFGVDGIQGGRPQPGARARSRSWTWSPSWAPTSWSCTTRMTGSVVRLRPVPADRLRCPAPGPDRHLPRRRGAHVRRSRPRAGQAGHRQGLRRRRAAGDDRRTGHLDRRRLTRAGRPAGRPGPQHGIDLHALVQQL